MPPTPIFTGNFRIVCVCVCVCVRDTVFAFVPGCLCRVLWAPWAPPGSCLSRFWVVSVPVAVVTVLVSDWLFVPGAFGLAVCAGSVLACVFVCACSVVLVRAWCVR